MNGAVFIAHNVNFDYKFIKAEYKRVGNTFNMDRMCAVKLSRKLYPELKSHALDKVIEGLRVKVSNRHRGYDDAEVLYKFFSAELEKQGVLIFKYIDELIIKSKGKHTNSTVEESVNATLI